jgi:hypothetical protein
MQQIAEWLEKLGMSEYAQRFADNDIDIEVLGDLTDADFDRLDVSIGHRRKMMRATREFAGLVAIRRIVACVPDRISAGSAVASLFTGRPGWGRRLGKRAAPRHAPPQDGPNRTQ